MMEKKTVRYWVVIALVWVGLAFWNGYLIGKRNQIQETIIELNDHNATLTKYLNHLKKCNQQ